MQKIRSAVLAIVVAASSVGCGGGGGGDSSAIGGGSQPPPTSPPPPTSTLGSATISWTAPSMNTDGSSLPVSGIAGFEIRYGQDSNALDSYVTVSTVGTTVYVIDNLTKGTWYFAVATRNSQGVLSTLSAPASKVIS